MHKKMIHVKADKALLHEVESFVEGVCDNYNILNSYFGNIMFAVTQTFLFAVGNTKEKESFITVSWASNAEGLVFRISLGDHYLELAAILNREPDSVLEKDDLSEIERNILIVRMLCDDIVFNNRLSEVQLVFYIASINKHLTIERLKELDLYYQKISQQSIVSKDDN